MIEKRWILIIGVLILMNSVLSSETNETKESIIVDFPDNVEFEEEFTINLVLDNFDIDIYDIKIEMLNETKNIAKRYYEDEWKSTNYWMKEILNLSEINEVNLKLKITENYNGTNNFTIKIRDSKGKIFEFENNIINIAGNINNKNEEPGNNEKSENNEEIQESSIDIELEWDKDDVENKNDFNIKIKVFNLENKEYDFRIWIENDENVISDRYDDESDTWSSGTYYLDNFFKGPGNKSGEIKMRIRDSYKDFTGKAKIFLKIRDGKEFSEDIIVLKKEVAENNPTKKGQEQIKNPEAFVPDNENLVTGKAIKLGSKITNLESESIKTIDDFSYESKTEKVKQYSLYVFAFLCVIIGILIAIRKLEQKIEKWQII